MKKGIRIITALLTVCMFASVFAGCGTSNVKTGTSQSSAVSTQSYKTEESAKEEKKVQLRYFTNSEVDKSEFDFAIPEWNKNNPNISVECVVLTGADSWDKIRVAIAGGEKIDVSVMERDTVSDKADKMYYKLNDLMQKEGFDYLKEFGEYGKATIFESTIWVNTEIFNKAGIAIPDENSWTFDDYFNLIREVTTKSADGKVQVYGGVHWQWSFPGVLDLATYGGWDIVKADGSPNVNDPVLKASLEKYYKALFIDKSMPTDAEMTASKITPLYDLLKGKFATMMGASNSALFFDVYKVAGHLTEETDAKNVFKLFKMPRFDNSSPANRIVPIVTSYSVTKTTQNPEEAYKFLRWFTTDCLVISSKVAHRVPTWKGADQNTLISNWRFYQDANKNLVEGKDRKDLYLKALDPTMTAYFPQNRSKYVYSSMLVEELKKEITLVLAGEKKVDDALAAAQKACEAVYEKEKK